MKRPTQARTLIPAGEPDITALLSGTHDPESLRLVMQWAYPQLHDIAVHHFRAEPPGRTLQPTALVNEMCVRFFEERAVFKNRRYFFRAASTAMRRVLVDRVRRRRAKKRGGDWQRVDFGEADRIGFEQPNELLDFDAALKRLEKVQPHWSEVVELRVFGQLSTAAAARVLGIARSTTGKRWTRAKAWLRDDLERLSGNLLGNQRP